MRHEDIVNNIKIFMIIQLKLDTDDYPGNIRKERANRLGISTQQADRYYAFTQLIPELQNLFFDYKISMSGLIKLKPYSIYDQRIVYDILCEAIQDGCNITRDILIEIIDKYKDGIHTWNIMKPHLQNIRMSVPPKNKICNNKKNFHVNVTSQMDGIEFENWVVNLLKAQGYMYVQTTPHSYDGGKDITAQKDGLRYIFQCKKSDKVGIKAIQEIFFAKKNADNVAVVITTGRFSAKAKEAAQEKGILCWDGDIITRMG